MSFSRTKCTTLFFLPSPLFKKKRQNLQDLLSFVFYLSVHTLLLLRFLPLSVAVSQRSVISPWILPLALAASKYGTVWHFIVVRWLFARFFFTESLTAKCSKFIDILYFVIVWKTSCSLSWAENFTFIVFSLQNPYSSSVRAVFALNHLQKVPDAVPEEVLNTHIFGRIKPTLWGVVAANHNSGFSIKFYYTWELGSGKCILDVKLKYPLAKTTLRR